MERKAFNFYNSYFKVYKELSDKDKLIFIDSLLNKQFYNIDPVNLKGMVKFAWLSQENIIQNQVDGYLSKMNISSDELINTPCQPPFVPPCQPPFVQEKGEEKEKEKGKEKLKYPSLEEIKVFFKEKGYNEEIAIKFYDSYTVADWIDSKGNKVKNWKQKAINVWFREEHKIKSSIKYLTYEEILSKGLNTKRKYIWSTIDGNSYAGLMTDDEKKSRNLPIEKIFTIQNHEVL